MNEEEKKRHMNEAMKLTNLAFVLSDVVNTCVMDANDHLARLGKEFRYEDKMNFKRMKDQIEKSVKVSKKAAEAIYQIKDAEAATMDSDWFYDLVVLCMDKIGENEQKATMLRSWLKNMTDEDVAIV